MASFAEEYARAQLGAAPWNKNTIPQDDYNKLLAYRNSWMRPGTYDPAAIERENADRERRKASTANIQNYNRAMEGAAAAEVNASRGAPGSIDPTTAALARQMAARNNAALMALQDTPPAPQPTGGGLAAQFMGIPTAQSAKNQARLETEAMAKGGRLDVPQTGAGVQSGGMPSGGGMSPQVNPYNVGGPMTWQQVVQGMTAANPDIAKRKDGPIILAMAAMQYLPLMDKQSQFQMKQIDYMLKMQMQEEKMYQARERTDIARERLEIAQQRADTYASKASGRVGGSDDKNYQNAVTNYQHAANALAANRGDKNLQDAFNRAKTRLESLDEQRNPTPLAQKTAQLVQGKTPEQIIPLLSENLVKSLSDEQRMKFATMLANDPANAQMRIDALYKKLSGGQNVTEIGKQGGGYY